MKPLFTPLASNLIPSSTGLLLTIGVLLNSGCGKPREPHVAGGKDLPAVSVRVQAVESKTRPLVEEVVGTVRAKLRATLEAKLSGRIESLPVKLGQPIKRGELIARLAAPEVKARLDQAEASLQQAERDWKRISALFSQQAITRAEHDAAEARYSVAKGAVAEAQAMMTYVEIPAPFDGVIIKKWADVGDLASPGKPLVDIEDPSALQLEADVPEAFASKIEPQAKLQVQIGVVAGDLLGQVSEVAPASDPASRTFRVKVDLPSSPALKSGQFGRLLVPVGEATSMRVPSSAVVQRGQMEIVFVVENQHARLHLVKTGRRIKDEAEILSGLNTGDVFVIEGAAQLFDGQPVESK